MYVKKKGFADAAAAPVDLVQLNDSNLSRLVHNVARRLVPLRGFSLHITKSDWVCDGQVPTTMKPGVSDTRKVSFGRFSGRIIQHCRMMHVKAIDQVNIETTISEVCSDIKEPQGF